MGWVVQSEVSDKNELVGCSSGSIIAVEYKVKQMTWPGACIRYKSQLVQPQVSRVVGQNSRSAIVLYSSAGEYW
jgi:hypothetical protein